jgi:molybdenum cofactor synthesis domain-containing protein
MSSSTPRETLTAAVITVSDSCARGERNDLSGPAVADLLRKQNLSVIGTEIVPDEQAAIQTALAYWTQEARLVVTTGGTGIASRDVTPEATLAVCDRLLEGVSERMRLEGSKKTLPAASAAVCAWFAGKIRNLEPARQSNRAVESLRGHRFISSRL